MQRNMCNSGGHSDSDGGHDIQVFWDGARILFFEVRADNTDSSAGADLFDYFCGDDKLGFRSGDEDYRQGVFYSIVWAFRAEGGPNLFIEAYRFKQEDKIAEEDRK